MPTIIKFEFKGVDMFMRKIQQGGFIFFDPDAIDAIVRKNTRPIVRELSIAYEDTHETKPNRYRKTYNLSNSIDLFQRKRKGQSDPYFTYYVGPRYKGKNNLWNDYGNAAHLLEYGTVNRFRANKKQGGQGRTLNKKRTGLRGVYGAKLSTGKIQPLGIIRKVTDKMAEPTYRRMKIELLTYVLKTVRKNGFK